MLIAPGLWLASPKNGNISNVGQRLSPISLPSCANWEYRDGQPIHKKPQLAGTSRNNPPTIFGCVTAWLGREQPHYAEQNNKNNSIAPFEKRRYPHIKP